MVKKIAFIGGGTTSAVGYTHYVASRMDGCFEIVAGAFSQRQDINLQSGASYGLQDSQVCKDWRGMLSALAGEIDVAVVLTPTPTHAEIVGAALDAGCNVIVEKALATSSADAAELAAQARCRNLHCLVTFNYTGYPAVREMRQRVREGQLGDIKQICIEMPQEGYLREGAAPQEWRQKDYEIPTVSLDLGVHVMHLSDFIAPCGPARSISSLACHSGAVSRVIDNVNCLVDYGDDAVGNYWWSKTALGYSNGLRVRVLGTKASLEWSQGNPEELHIAFANGRREILDRGNASPGQELATPAYNRFKAGHPAGFLEAFANLYRDFHSALAEPPAEQPSGLLGQYSAETAAAGLSMLERIHECSSSANKPC
ncbi:MAG: putative dehydrogenase [Halieaceae bacterium]|jgi:predicted dehydrogenase